MNLENRSSNPCSPHSGSCDKEQEKTKIGVALSHCGVKHAIVSKKLKQQI